MVKTWMVNALLETGADQIKREKRKANRHLKLAMEAIQCYVLAGNMERARKIAETHNIDEKQFSKIVDKVQQYKSNR